MNDLLEWKNSKNRKPLILRGARQTGKTWLMKEFGKRYWGQTVYINFERERRLHTLLENTLDPAEIIAAIEALENQRIVSEDCLIILDEIQEEPRALTALKYFCEDKSEYAIIAAGSLLGVALHEGTSFPVGKVSFVNVYPMNFREFLDARGKDNLRKKIDQKNLTFVKGMKDILKEELRLYYTVGGMPEVVMTWLEDGNYLNVRDKQMELLDAYRQDFSKHASSGLVTRLNQVWDSIPGQLSKENKKFIFGQIRKGARAKDFELAIRWLQDCGLIHLVHRVTKPGIPLKSYEERSVFKIFLNDVGLLGALAGLPLSTFIDSSQLFVEFKGALTEQYVLQQMLSDMRIHPQYYSAENSKGELDYLIQRDNEIIPVEVKAEENLRSKSLRAFVDKYPVGKGIRISMSDYREQEWMINLPLYAFMKWM